MWDKIFTFCDIVKYLFVTIFTCLFGRCDGPDKYNTFDHIVMDKREVIAADSIIDLADITTFHWDTMYYYRGGGGGTPSLWAAIDSFNIYTYIDMNDAILFTDKNRNIVFEDSWEYTFDDYHDHGVIFSAPKGYLRVSRDDALFKIAQQSESYMILEHFPKENIP